MERSLRRHRNSASPFFVTVQALESRSLLNAGFLDPTFDGDGMLRPTGFYGLAATQAHAVATAAGGKVVIAGIVGNAAGAARINADGTPDTTFGGDGWVTLPLDGSIATAAVVQPDQKVVIGGRSNTTNFGLARFNADGSPDTSFAGDGTLEFHLGGLGEVAAVVVLPSGKILAAGGGTRWWVARVNADGTPDETFGLGGIAAVDASGGTDRAEAVAAYPDGRVLVSGTARATMVWEEGVGAVARLTADGRVDMSFGGDGVIEIPAFSALATS
jgi:uncharacterized delta-60 repeat protein